MFQHPKRIRFATAFRRLPGLLLTLAGTLASLPAQACTTCNRPLQQALFGPDFAPTLLKMLLPILLILVLVRLLYRLR
jgi:hypothetical protein